MSNTFKLLTYFDLIGVEPLFFINEKVSFKTFSGGIQTLILLVILLILIGIEIDKYLFTTSPQELQVTEFYQEYQTTLNKSNFFLAYSFTLQDLKNKLNKYTDFELDDYIKSLVVIHYGKYEYHKFRNDISNSSIVNCTDFNLGEFEISYYTKNELINKAFCIDLNNSIMNTSEDNGYSTLEISIYLNKSYFDDYIISHYISLEEKNEMSDILNNYDLELNIYYQSILNSPSEYTKVANIIRINKEKRIFNLIDYDMHYFSAIKKITSKKKLDFLRNGKYSKNISYFNTFHTDVISPYIDYYYEGCRKLMTYTFCLDTTHTVQILKYPTFFEICSEIGGTFNIIFSVLKIIFRWIQKFEEIHYLSYKCFSNKLLDKKNDKSLKNALRPFSFKNLEYIKEKNNSNKVKNNINDYFERSQNFFVNYNKINSNINLNCNIKGNYQKSISDNKIIVSNRNKKVSVIHQLLEKRKLISVKNKEIDFKQYILEKNKFRKYDWRKEIYYFFCNECQKSKSFFINLFQTFLSIENIMRWNQEWVTFKMAEMDSIEQLAMKYIDIDKIKRENNFHSYEQSNEELNEVKKKLKENRNTERKYENLEKLLL